MSKRNLILLIIILAVVSAFVVGFFYLYQPKTDTAGDEEGSNFFADLFPFGKNKNMPSDGGSPTDISGYIPPEKEKALSIKFKKVSSFPVAGYGVFMKERYKDDGGTEFAPFLRYADQTTGNIYQTFADKIDERKFSNTVIPKAYDAYFGNNGESVAMRYIKEGTNIIETFLGNSPKEYLGADGGLNEMQGSFLPENIKDISISQDFSKMFYLFGVNDIVVGVTLDFATGTKTQVFDSPFTEWLSFWPNEKMITLTTKPSSNILGYMYAINPNDKNSNKILGDINGLTTLASPDGKMVLYGNGSLSLYIFNIETGNTTTLGARTLPEKCAWNTDVISKNVIYCAVPKSVSGGGYPDTWYMGEVSFTDEIWILDAESGNGAMILDPLSVEGGESIDGIKLSLDENQNFLFFVNKKDSYLWELELK